MNYVIKTTWDIIKESMGFISSVLAGGLSLLLFNWIFLSERNSSGFFSMSSLWGFVASFGSGVLTAALMAFVDWLVELNGKGGLISGKFGFDRYYFLIVFLSVVSGFAASVSLAFFSVPMPSLYGIPVYFALVACGILLLAFLFYGH